MMMKNKMVYIVVIVLVFLNGCASIWVSERLVSDTQKPSWVSEIRDGYFVGVSPICRDEYIARTKAMADARKQIIESLGGLVESELVDQIMEKRGTAEIKDEFSRSKIKVISKNIISVKPEKVYIEKWIKRVGFRKYRLYRAYVLVPFSKKDHDKFIMEYIASSFLAGSKLYDRALALMRDGDVIEAMDVIRNIKRNIKPVLELTGVRPSLKLDIMYLDDDVEGLRRQILRKLRLKPLRETYNGVWGEALDDTIKVRLFLDNKDKVPVEGVEVNFIVIEGDVDISVSSRTDKEGIAYCIVNRIRKPRDIVIEARTCFPGNSGIKDKKCRIYINQDNTALVLTDEKYISGKNGLRILRDVVSQELTGRNFKVKDGDFDLKGRLEAFRALKPGDLCKAGDSGFRFVVVGYLYITRYQKIEEGFYFAWCNAGLKFYNAKTGELLASFVYEDKAAGNSLEDAEIKVANKVSREFVNKLLGELGI